MTDEIIGTYIGPATGGGHLIELTGNHDEFFHNEHEEEVSSFESQWIGVSDFESVALRGFLFTNTNSTSKKQEKAKEFLKSWLTDQEYEDLQDGNLIIPSKIFPDRTYKIKAAASQMVEVYTAGMLDHKLCAIAKDPRFENDDTVLAKILMIKTNEEQFLKIAEKHQVHIDSGFGRYFTSNVNTNTDSLTIAWSLTGDIELRTEGRIQPGQVVSFRSILNDTPVDVNSTSSVRLRSRHNEGSRFEHYHNTH